MEGARLWATLAIERPTLASLLVPGLWLLRGHKFDNRVYLLVPHAPTQLSLSTPSPPHKHTSPIRHKFDNRVYLLVPPPH